MYHDQETDARELAEAAREFRRRTGRRKTRKSPTPPAKTKAYVMTVTLVVDAPSLTSARDAVDKAVRGVPGFRKGQHAPYAAVAVRP